MKLILFYLFLLGTSLISGPTKNVLDYLKLIQKDQSELIIEEKDLKNGFIRYSMKAMEGYSEFAIWIKKNKEVIAGVSEYSCGPGCGLSSVKFYEFKTDSFTEVTEKYYPEKKIKAVFDKRLAALNKKEKIEDAVFWVSIPKKGTTILIGINKDSISVDNIVNIAELKWNGNNFDLVEKK